MKAKVYRAVCLIVALVVAVFTAGYAFAWFIDRRNSPFEISGASAGAYFDSTSGDGTSADQAFVIANATHMRNLAVLQNTGRFVDAAGNPKTYYFEIKKTVDEIDMDGLWLPPIGNDKDPFIGVFNGNGKTITNLKVTTDKTLLTVDNYPTQASPDYEFSNAVGLFGNTGEASEIRNFILDNPIVLVGSESKTLYGSAGKKVVGIAVGHVAGKCSSIGVRATDDAETSLQIVDANTKYSTFNSILGELGEGVESSVTGGGHTAGTGGSGSAFGASFDVATLLTRLRNIYKGKYGVEYNNTGTPIENGLPLIDKTNDEPVPATGEKVAFTVDAQKSNYEYNSNAKEVVGNENIGYFIGNQNKIQISNIKFSDPLIAPSDMMNGSYKNAAGETPEDSKSTPRQLFVVKGPNQNYQTNTIRPMTDEEFAELPDGVKTIIPSENGTVSERTIRLQQRYSGSISFTNTEQNDGWAYLGQVNYRGKSYGEDVAYKEAGGIALPNNAIWFKPANVGKFRFVMYTGSNGRGFKLIKIIRNSATKENPFAGTDLTGSIVTENALQFSGTLPYYLMLYFEYDMSQDEIDAGNVEFMLTQGDGSGAYFVYLDIGASAAEDTSAVNPDVQVSAVDFIYDKVEISQADVTGTDIKLGDFIVTTSGSAARYDSSKTSVYFEELTTVLKIVYVRLHKDTAGNHSGKTICLEGSTPTLNTSSEVKATYATYVCPTISGGSGTVSGGGGGGGGTEEPDPDPTPDPDSGTYEFTYGGTNSEEWSTTSTETSTTQDNAYTGRKLSNSTYVILSASGTKAQVSLTGFTRSTNSEVNVIVEFLDTDGNVIGSLSGKTLAEKAYGDITLTNNTFESSTPFASVRISCADTGRTFALVSANITIE